MTGWLLVTAAWGMFAVRFRQQATMGDRGMLLTWGALALGLTMARPEVAAFMDTAVEVPLSSLAKRVAGMLASLGVVVYMSGVAAYRVRPQVAAAIAVIVVLVVTYVVGAHRWGETEVFFADPTRFRLSVATWLAWTHFLLWYVYLGTVLMAMAVTCAAAAVVTSGALHTQLVLLSAGSAWLGLSPIYSLAGISGLISYSLSVDRTVFIAPGVFVLIAGMAWQALRRGTAGMYAWWLYTRLGGLWKLLTEVQKQVVLPQMIDVSWSVRVHRRTVECHDVLLALSAYLPEDSYGAGRVDPRTTAMRLREALAAKKVGARAEQAEPGRLMPASKTVTEEARWLIQVWQAWRYLNKTLGPIEADGAGSRGR